MDGENKQVLIDNMGHGGQSEIKVAAMGSPIIENKVRNYYYELRWYHVKFNVLRLSRDVFILLGGK